MFLVDVSGSMAPYARALTRFAHAAVAAHRRGRVEVFALGTRVTRITRELATHDPDRALRLAGEAVADWAGGTRLGDGLRGFNDRWGVRGLARGAMVVILSDGWDRGDPAVLGDELARLRRVATIVWVHPPGLARVRPPRRGNGRALPRRRVRRGAFDACSSAAAVVPMSPMESTEDLLATLPVGAEGVGVAIARVVDLDGSGPRSPGAAMAVNERGEVVGSVSGGCVEGAVVTEALEVLRTGERKVVTFGYSDDDAFAVGLTCGGIIHLYLETLDW